MEQQHPIESRDKRQTILINANDGTKTILGGTEERVIVHPDGAHEFLRTEERISTLDGHMLDPAKEPAYRCVICNKGPYSSHAMCACQEPACRQMTCRSCAHHSPDGTYCTPCHRRKLWRSLWSFIMRIT